MGGGAESMTLIVNVLHRDFTLLAGDRLANASGPVTVTAGSLTIKMPAGGKITGLFPKVITSKGGRAAVGAAGTIADHTFREAFQAADSPESALGAVRATAHDFFDFSARDYFIDGVAQMRNEVITTFYDQEKSAFWTFIIDYTKFQSNQYTFARKTNPKAEVLSVGSGTKTMRERVSTEEIHRFLDAVTDNWSERQLAEWLGSVFKVVSEVNESVSESYEAVIATREDPFFRMLPPN